MISLPILAEQLQGIGILQKSFMECSRSEILQLVTAVFSAVDESVPLDGWSSPKVEGGTLIIPYDSHPKYHWWTGEGQSIFLTLAELGAPLEVVRKHYPKITEEEWINKLVPF